MSVCAMHCPDCGTHGTCLAEATVWCARCDLVWIWWNAKETWSLWQVQLAVMIAAGKFGSSWWRFVK